MYDLAKVTLENEMDLVLAHKRSMKLAELAGLSLPAQTTFATAVSEIARNTIDNGRNGCLTLGISDERKRSIVACIKDDNLNDPRNKSGLNNAKKLVDRLNIFTQEDEKNIELYQFVPNSDKIDIHLLDQWRIVFRNEPPISPYDEIKRKSEQLKQLTEKIKESEDHYRILTNTLPLMMFSVNEEGKLTYVNQWMTEYFGYSLNELNSLRKHDLIHEEDYPSETTVRAAIQMGAPVKAEWRLRNKDGNFNWHLVSISPISTESKTEWFGFLVDIHAQKLFERTLKDNHELKEAQQLLHYHIKELSRSNEELQQFAFVASHDLQEPLRKVIFYSDYLQSQKHANFDEKSMKYLNGLVEASHRMRVLITDLLAFSQVDKKKLEFRDIKLDELIKEAIFDYELIIREKNATIKLDSLPLVQGDRTMLRRLFENLLSNALKYVPEGVIPEITISAVIDQDSVVISFSDNGIGFEEEYIPKIFSLFQRLHDKSQFSGTGLGLAICRKIAEMHHGSITAKSQVNRGSSFFVTLPIKQP